MSERRDAFTTVVPDNVCSRCGYQRDSASGSVRDATPKAGDWSICMKCGHVAVFVEGLTLREPTPEEADLIRRDPVIQQHQQAVWNMHELGVWEAKGKPSARPLRKPRARSP